MSRQRPLVPFVVAGLVVALLLVFFVAPRASTSPDGLERVAADQRLNTEQQPSPVAAGPLADYSVTGVHDPTLGTGVAGAAGIAVTFGASLGLAAVLRRRRGRGSPPAPAGSGPA